MKNKISHQKVDKGKIISFSQRLNNPRLSINAIEDLRNIEDIAQVNAIIRRAGKSCKNRIFSSPLPSSYSQLKPSSLIFKLPDERLVKWLQYEICAYASEINKFIELQNNYELTFIDGNYTLARECLSDIENICVSLWSLENEFILLQFSEGLHANLAYLSDINNDEDISIVIKIFAMFYSKKAEDNISASKYKDEVNSYLIHYKNAGYESIYGYLCYKFLPDNLFKNMAKNVFYLESNSSIIDRYITFKEVLRKSIYEVEFDFQRDLVLAATFISHYIHDSELDQILSFINSGDCQLISASTTKDFITICDLYTSGKYGECIAEATDSLKYIGNSFELYEIIAKSATFLDNFDFDSLKIAPLQQDLIRCLFDIFKKNDNYENVFRRLYKLSFTLSNQAWARQLYAVLLLEMGSSENSLIMAENFLQSKFVNPKILLGYINERQKREFLNKLLQEYSDSSTVYLWTIFISGDCDQNYSSINIERRDLYLARFLMEHGNFQNAIQLLENLICQHNQHINNWYFAEKVATALVNCYLSVKDFKNVLKIFVKYYFINLNFKKRIEFGKILDGLSCVEKSVCSLCEYLIFLHVANSDSYNLYVACDNFLVAHEVDRPSELAIGDCCSEIKHFVYILYLVFTETILSKLLAFDNTDEVEEERLHILHKLIEINNENSSIYIREMNEISIKSTVRKYIDYTNEGKIYIDIDGVKKYANENLKERFDRYLEVKKISSDNFKIIDLESEGIILSFKSPARKLYYIRDIRFATFKNLFLDILEVFVSSKEFGLNNYLSMRIRHGTLTGQLRKPFDDANIVSQKNSTDQYQDILYWNGNLPLSEDDINRIQESLKAFAKKIDDIIALVKSEWIQIKTEKTNVNGLFNYIFSDEEIYEVFTNVSHIEGWDIFFEKIIIFLIERTKKNMDVVKATILSDLKYAFLDLLGELLGEVQSIDREAKCFKLTSAITSCKTYIQTVLNKIINWFEFSQNKKIDQFDFELAIKASTFLMGYLYKQNINPTIINGSSSTVLFRGEYFNCFFDLLNILFENIVKHSNVESINNTVKISFNIDRNKLYFVVENTLGQGYMYCDSREKLDNIVRALQADEAKFELTSREGGSGILKIRKILQHDLRSTEWAITPTIVESRFKIEIETDVSGIVYENIDN